MNEINRELKGYTASGTSISLGFSAPRRMAGHITSGPISMSDFYGAKSHIAIVAATVYLSTSFISGYIKDYYGSGSHLGSLSTSAGVYIPSSGDTSNSLTEREVLACYTEDSIYSSTNDFYLILAGQIYAQNTFTGIKELSPFGSTTGMGTRALADATFSSATGGIGTRDQWKWTGLPSRWNGGTRYIHWY